MSERAAEKCQNCGAPLTVENGRCKFCGATFAPVVNDDLGAGGLDDDIPALSNKVLGDGGLGLPLPAFPLLSGLWMISMDGAVQRFLDQGELESARQLVSAVQTAGERAADAGLESISIDPGAYQPVELWAFELARDLLAQLAAVDGVDGQSARLARSTVSDYCDPTWTKAFAGAAKKLTTPPAELAALRSSVPSVTAKPGAPGAADAEKSARKHFWNRG